jgi:exodeoxyribonuclease V alpha subunit
VNNGTVAEVIGFMGTDVMVKSYDDDRTFYIEGDYPEVKLAYGMTVFKSQGSEAHMVIYFHSNHIFETKRLVYTAMTRARKKLRIYTPTDGFKMSMDVARYTSVNSK